MLGIAGSVFYTEALPINADNREFVHDATCCNKLPLPQRSKWEPATEWNSLPPVATLAAWRSGALLCAPRPYPSLFLTCWRCVGDKVFHIPLGQEA